MNHLIIPVIARWNSARVGINVRITGHYLQPTLQDYRIVGVDVLTGLEVGACVNFATQTLGEWEFKSGQEMPEQYREIIEAQA